MKLDEHYNNQYLDKLKDIVKQIPEKIPSKNRIIAYLNDKQNSDFGMKFKFLDTNKYVSICWKDCVTCKDAKLGIYDNKNAKGCNQSMD